MAIKLKPQGPKCKKFEFWTKVAKVIKPRGPKWQFTQKKMFTGMVPVNGMHVSRNKTGYHLIPSIPVKFLNLILEVYKPGFFFKTDSGVKILNLILEVYKPSFFPKPVRATPESV
ncbi:hypothetical protein Hanom_Chr12g01181841 [Helianthus anomalus]